LHEEKATLQIRQNDGSICHRVHSTKYKSQTKPELQVEAPGGTQERK